MKTFLTFTLLLISLCSVQAQRFTRVFSTLQDLLVSNPSSVDTNVVLLGRNFVNDGGGGNLYWAAGSSLATNLGTIHPSYYAGANGRWLRPPGNLNILWFGATPTTNHLDFATGMTANNLAFTNAMAVMGTKFSSQLDLGEGFYNMTVPIVLPPAGQGYALSGIRRDGTVLRYLGSGTHMRGGGTNAGAAAYLFRNFQLSAEGNGNVAKGLVITNDANRDLVFENFGVHQFANDTGLTIDGVHSIEGSLKLDYNNRNFEFGLNQFLNIANLFIISENAPTNTYSGVIANSASVHLSGTYETSGLILVTNCTDFVWDGYAENNFPGTFNIVHTKSAKLSGFIDGNGVNDYGIRLGDNNFGSLGHGYDITTTFQFLGAAVVIGSGGVGPRAPDIRDFSTFAVATNILFESNLDLEPLVLRNSGIDFRYDLSGHILSAVGGPIAGTHPALIDLSGGTNRTFILPRAANGSEPSGGPGGAMDWIYNTGRTKIYDGTNWNVLGYGDGTVQTVSGGTGVVNTVVKWTGNGFQLSTNTIMRENGSSVIIGSTNTPPSSTKLWVVDGGTNDMTGTSSTFIVRNGGISTNANIAEFQSNAGGTSFIARNDGNIGLPNVGASGLSFLNASTNIDRVTTMVNLSLDTGTKTLTGQQGTLTNFSIGALTNLFSVANSTTYPTLNPVDLTANKIWYWNNTANEARGLNIGANLTINTATDTLDASGGGGGGSATNAYNTVMEEGAPLTARTNLNFIGSAFTAADNAGANRTDVTTSSRVNAVADQAGTGIYVATSGSAGATRTITATEGVKVVNGSGVAGAPALSSDFPALTTVTTNNPATDYVEIYSNSASAHRKTLISDLGGGNGLNKSFHTKILASNTDTTFMRLTPPADLTAFGVHVRGSVILYDNTAAPANQVQAKTFTFVITCQRNDANGGVDASGSMTIDENSLPGPGWTLYDNIGAWTGATSADITMSTIYGGTATIITVYIQVEQHGAGTITFL